MNTLPLPQKDLTWEARPFSELVRLSWPTVISLLSVSVMTLVDTLFIGWLGSVELAATGLGGVCIFTVASFGLALLSAAKVKVSESFGNHDTHAVERALGAFLRLALVLGGLSIIAGLLTGVLLPYLSADRATGNLAGTYASIRSFGLIFVLFSSAIGQWLQAQGDSRSAMRAAVAANVANIPLNAVFIFVLDLGVVGAALATVLSGFTEMFWLVLVQKRASVPLPGGRSTAPGLHWEKASFLDAYRTFLVGLPTGVERVLDMIAFAAVPILLSQVGPNHVAAHQIVLQVMLLSFLPLIALSDSVSVLIAQAVGAGRPALVRSLTGLSLGMALSYATLCAIVCLLLTKPIVSLFTPDRSVIEVGVSTLLIASLLQWINAIYNQLKGVLRGLSVFRVVALVTIGCAWVITPPFTYLVGVRAGFGAPGAWAVLCVEVTLGACLLGSQVRRRTLAL